MTRQIVGEKFEYTRTRWIEQALQALPADSTLLDVGAGECANRQFCSHLKYTSQDIAEYDGSGDGKGLQTGGFDFSAIDIVCDLLDIPEETKYDAVLLTEVLEHVPDPVASLMKVCRLLKPGGMLILTAPFCSLTHFAPHFYCTGFSSYFYRHHLQNAGLDIVEMTPHGGYFDWISHEVGRVQRVYRQYAGRRLGFFGKAQLWLTRALLRRIARQEQDFTGEPSSELLTNGYFVRAVRAA